MKDQRDELLKAKQGDIIRQLETWAVDRDLLRPGEVVVFGPLRIEQMATVRPDEAPMATEELSFRGRQINRPDKIEFLRPARMTSDDIKALVSKLTHSKPPPRAANDYNGSTSLFIQ